MSTSIDLAAPGSANPRGRQSISTHRRTAAADTLGAVGRRGRPTPLWGKIALGGTAVAILAAATALAASLPSGTYTTTVSGAKNTQLNGR